MNCLPIIKIAFIIAMLAIPASAFSAEGDAYEVCKVSCPLYDITLPTNWICEYAFDAAGMPPVRGSLLLDAVGGEIKCHLCYQSWECFDINHVQDAQSCFIRNWTLPSGEKPDFGLVKALIDRRSDGTLKWVKIAGGYMCSSFKINEGMKIEKNGIAKKVVTRDRCIKVMLDGQKYVHLLEITVPESRYKSDKNFRLMVDNVWKSWKVKK